MNNINYLATEIRVAALDTSEMVLRHSMRGNTWQFMLYKGEEAIGGVELEPSTGAPGWWEVATLWSHNSASTFILLFGVLETAN